MKQYVLVLILILSLSCLGQTNSLVKLPWDKERVNKANAGDPDAQAYIGTCYFFGDDGVVENNAEAIKWFQKSYKGGSPYGKYYLGLAYLNGYGIKLDKIKGRNLTDAASAEIEQRAKRGDAEAQYYLGQLYEYEADDIHTALKYYEMASKHDYYPAQLAAAAIYQEIEGEYSRKAFEIFKKGIELKSPIAQYQFAKYYINGIEVEQSIEKGINLYLESANNNYGLAQAQIGKYYEDGYGVERNIEEAIKWYKKASEHNIYSAQFQLACLYRDGYGVDRNYELALKYMKLAAKHEVSKAIESYELLQNKGAAFYNSLPKRLNFSSCELTENDPFFNINIGGNFNEAPYEFQVAYLKNFKREKVREWGEIVAMKVANHIVEIGFSEEQIKYSQGNDPSIYQTYTIRYSKGKLRLLKYPHCDYFILNDSLIAMCWSNGVQIGDKRLIVSYNNGEMIVIDNQ